MVDVKFKRRRSALECAQIPGLLAFMGDLPRCNALRTTKEAEAASRLVDLLGLSSHHDPQKNWDTLKCFRYVLGASDPGGPVLDVGGSPKSPILLWLKAVGFENLYACNLDEKLEHGSSGIRFSVQDLCATNYEDHFFEAITSISVIEHGVQLITTANAMGRISKSRPG